MGLKHIEPTKATILLVVEPTPLKNMSSSVGMIKFPIYGKKMFQTTNQSNYLTLKNMIFTAQMVIIQFVVFSPHINTIELGATVQVRNLGKLSIVQILASIL
jgi:hypothetical protein